MTEDEIWAERHRKIKEAVARHKQKTKVNFKLVSDRGRFYFVPVIS